MYFKAKALNKGKPTTTPRATIANGKICFRLGSFSLKTNKAIRASIPAMEALATVRNTGLNSKTAILVAGKEPLNNNTPIKPFNQPCVVFSFTLLKFNSDIVLYFDVKFGN